MRREFLSEMRDFIRGEKEGLNEVRRPAGMKSLDADVIASRINLSA